MSNKYLPTALLVLMLLSVAAGIWLLDSKTASVMSMRSATPPNSADMEITDADLRSLEQLEQGLAMLPLRQARALSDQPPIAVRRVEPAAQSVARPRSPLDRRSFEISMVYVSDDQRRAVINGQYASVGDQLNGGGRVESITEQSITIVDGPYRRTLANPRFRFNGR